MAYIGVSPSNGVRQTYDYTATAGQTSFSGSDNNSQTLTYTDSAYIDVYQNGILLIPSDYTATTGTTVVLDTGATVSDTLQIVVYDVFSVADTVSASDGGSFGGNVGVGGTLSVTGATTLSSTLATTGNATFSGDIIKSTSGTSNFAAGVNAGNSIASGGNYNTVVGDESGTAISTGDNNTFVGYVAGDAVTTGTESVALGSNSLSASVGADKNTALGAYALRNDTEGESSVAVGHQALNAQNFTSATSAYNVAVGANAGVAVTTGVENVMIGALAGAESTTADDNVFVGFKAGGGGAVAAQTGHDNICIGSSAGLSLTSGAGHVIIGERAGQSTTTASNNIMIGQLCGAHARETNGSYNVLVGNFCDSSSTSVDHEIIIGYDVTGQGVNNFTFGNASNDSNIAFGATSISAPSDERYKEEVTTSTAGLSFINDLRPVTFKWKKEKDIPTDHKAYVKDSDARVMGRGETTQHGFIAQEVKTAIDNHSEIKDGFDMWMEDPNDGRQRIADGALIPMLVKAIQELSAEVKALKGE